MAGHEVLVLDGNEAIGMETSARNSEVIHAGLYYPSGSAKARLCVEGKHRLYEYCASKGIPHQNCGKLVVATHEEQIATLQQLQAQGRANGAGELSWLEQAALAELEPEVQAVAGLYSETTGIIDSHAFMLALLGDVEAAGGVLVLHTTVNRLSVADAGLIIETGGQTLLAARVINAAGHGAPALARQAGTEVRGYFARGRYYTYSGASPFRHLVYPLPEPGGLGVHVTLDLAGQARFGPDVEWIEHLSYEFDEATKAEFVASIQRYFPGVEADRLNPGYTGVRPKISGPREVAADFRVSGPEDHGVPGLVHLLGIESPGLTASLALADAVQESLAC